MVFKKEHTGMKTCKVRRALYICALLLCVGCVLLFVGRVVFLWCGKCVVNVGLKLSVGCS